MAAVRADHERPERDRGTVKQAMQFQVEDDFMQALNLGRVTSGWGPVRGISERQRLRAQRRMAHRRLKSLDFRAPVRYRSQMRRTVLWLSANACCVLSACGPTIAVDDASVAAPDAAGRPPPPPVDAGRPDVDAGSPPSLLISEVRSRGMGGAADEFVELYNPSTDPVTLDSSWTLDGRSNTSASYSARWMGTGKIIPAHGHFLLAGSTYTQQPAADESLLIGITDATALRLSRAGVVVDALCYGFDATTLMVFVNDPTYVREGMPAMNVHDNMTGTNVDASIERKPGGTAGNGQDTNDNATDFAALTPSNPQNSASAPSR